MTTYQPTFKPTPQKRAWHERLTPIAWVLIAVVGLALFACLGAGVYALTRERERAFTLPPTPTPEPTVGPTATPTPAPTATVWWEGMVTPTATVEVPYPAWWSDQMTQDEEGRWWPPQEVIEQVAEDFQTNIEEHDTLAKANDLAGMVENVARWYTGHDLPLVKATFERRLANGEGARYVEWALELPPQVQGFTPDGLECTVGRAVTNGTKYQWVDGELVAVETLPGGLYLFGMQYDPIDGRWKMATAELVPLNPTPATP